MGERAGWRKGMGWEWWAELIGDAPRHLWIPAFAGMTKREGGNDERGRLGDDGGKGGMAEERAG